METLDPQGGTNLNPRLDWQDLCRGLRDIATNQTYIVGLLVFEQRIFLKCFSIIRGWASLDLRGLEFI